MKRIHTALAGLIVLAVVSFDAATAEARRGSGSHYSGGRSHFSIGVNTGGYGYGPGYGYGYAPPPVIVAPRPVVYPAYSYYAPPPVVVAPVGGWGPAYRPSCGLGYGGGGASFSYTSWR